MSPVLRQDEAQRWAEASVLAFWIAFPEVLDAEPPYRPPGREASADRFQRFGLELHVLECDLAECLNEFEQSYQALYRGQTDLALKKFGILYHTDNFLVRVHKLVENVYALLALMVEVDPFGPPRTGEPPLRRGVADRLDERGLGKMHRLLEGFQRDSAIRTATAARNLFVHLYRDDSKFEPDEWRLEMLRPASRLRDYGGGEDEIDHELRRLVEPPHLDAYADRKLDELLGTLRRVQRFRDALYGLLLEAASRAVETRPPETVRRRRGIIEWARQWRELAGGEL